MGVNYAARRKHPRTQVRPSRCFGGSQQARQHAAYGPTALLKTQGLSHGHSYSIHNQRPQKNSFQSDEELNDADSHIRREGMVDGWKHAPDVCVLSAAAARFLSGTSKKFQEKEQNLRQLMGVQATSGSGWLPVIQPDGGSLCQSSTPANESSKGDSSIVLATKCTAAAPFSMASFHKIRLVALNGDEPNLEGH